MNLGKNMGTPARIKMASAGLGCMKADATDLKGLH
jgi:hypothetical protein